MQHCSDTVQLSVNAGTSVRNIAHWSQSIRQTLPPHRQHRKPRLTRYVCPDYQDRRCILTPNVPSCRTPMQLLMLKGSIQAPRGCCLYG